MYVLRRYYARVAAGVGQGRARFGTLTYSTITAGNGGITAEFEKTAGATGLQLSCDGETAELRQKYAKMKA
eukprot:713042-Karenia_brevis.AAC.1